VLQFPARPEKRRCGLMVFSMILEYLMIELWSTDVLSRLSKIYKYLGQAFGPFGNGPCLARILSSVESINTKVGGLYG
jgi:hypothetical protein